MGEGLTPAEWEEFLLGVTEEVGRRVSSIADAGERGVTVGTGAAGDTTIKADREAEDVILKALAVRGGVRAVSEEAGASGDLRGKTVALIDPLDGSSNYERGIPFYCTSVAVAEGETVDDIGVGVVRDLVSGDVYSATKGGGARKNGAPIRTSVTTEPGRAVVGIDLSRSPPELVREMAPLVGGVKRQVHLGANALELCYVADGRTDSFVDLRGVMRITDFAAGYLIAKEAGATVSDPGGGRVSPRFDLEDRFSFVASANVPLHTEILRLCPSPGTRSR